MIDIDAWKVYYSDDKNLEKISSYCKYREIVIMRMIRDKKIVLRSLKIFKPEHLIFWIERLNLKNTLFDIYHSVASVKIPFPISPDLHKLKETREYLNIHWNQILTGFDLFVDFDIETNEDRPKAKEYALMLAIELKKQGYTQTEVWDTSRGFHLWDRGKWEPLFIKNLIMDTCLELGIPMSMPIKEINGKRYKARGKKWIEMKGDEEIPIASKPWVDCGIYDIRRIKKVPFSLHSKTGKPVLRIL